MKLIILYGPPAVGKLTIAKELAKLTGFKLFDNHSILDILNNIFGWENPTRARLEYEIRGKIVEQAAKNDINLIVTGSIMAHNKLLYRQMIDYYENHGGECFLVQLTADRKILSERVSSESRTNKINNIKQLEEYYDQFQEVFEKFMEGEQLVIDTSDISPQEAATKISEHYHLV